jgi:ribosome-associated translation inhibitor RaiA
MKVQINTDKNVEGGGRLDAYYSGEIERVLARFDDKVTRIEVHFGDENSAKFGLNDKRCLIEARPANMQPIAVTEHADTIEKAFNGALEKIKKVLHTTFDKLNAH